MKKWFNSIIMAIFVMMMMSLFPATTDAQSRFTVHGGAMYMSSGIAPVPAFETDHGALFCYINNDFGRVETFVDWAFVDGLSTEESGNFGDMWFFDTWIQYYPIDGNNTRMRFGFNWAPFGQPYGTVEIPGQSPDVVREVTRYAIGEWYAETKLAGATMSLTWWHTVGLDERTIDGEYVSLKMGRTISLGSTAKLFIQPDIFITSFTGKNDGVFYSKTLRVSPSRGPWKGVGIGFQYVGAFTTNVPEFKSSLALNVGWNF